MLGLAAMRKQCAEQAEREFTKEGYETGGSDTAGFEDHYNPSTGRCLMTIESTQFATNQTFTYLTYMELQDIYEHRVFATYMSASYKDGGGKRTVVCWLIPSTRLKRRCASEQEYRQFVSLYME